MCLDFRSALITAAGVWVAGSLLASGLPGTALRICANPNNLPFSNQQQQGFDNEISRLVARDLGKTATYVWAREQGETFVRKTLLAKRCDVLMGIPSAYREATPTIPYYRSTYVFVSRRDRNLRIQSLNDPALARLRIGVHVISDDSSNLPPAQALANRGLFRSMETFSLYGDLYQPNPPAALINAVSKGEVDVAIAWGPLAGYFAKASAARLEIVPVSPQVDRPYLPFTYSIAMGVRPEDKDLSAALNGIIRRRLPQIHRILKRYAVPLLDEPMLQAEKVP